MKKYLLKTALLILLFTFSTVINYAQDGIKFRIATNSGWFVSEPGGDDFIADPIAAGADTIGSARFKPQIKFGIEAEISVPLSPVFALGIEAKNVKFGGTNDDPAYFNYFASPYSPILNYQQEPLMYDTKVTSFLGNVRITPFGQNSFTPYLKLSGGIALVATDLRFKNAEDQVEIMDPLYSRGTRLSISESDRFSTAQFGAGAGFEYVLAGNLSLSAELSLAYINSDIINGVPNFTYDAEKTYSVYQDLSTLTTQLSVGLCYSMGGSKAGKYGKPGKKRPNYHRPTYKRRR